MFTGLKGKVGSIAHHISTSGIHRVLNEGLQASAGNQQVFESSTAYKPVSMQLALQFAFNSVPKATKISSSAAELLYIL